MHFSIQYTNLFQNPKYRVCKFHKEKKTSCLRSRLSKLMSTQVQTLKCNELQCFVCLGNNYLGKAATEVNIETRRNSTTIVVLF